MTLAKEFAFTERTRLKFQSDVYNVLNHPNFANPGTVRLTQTIPTGTSTANGVTTFTGAGVQPGTPFATSGAASGGSFGVLTNTVTNQVGIGGARQIQLSLRLLF